MAPRKKWPTTVDGYRQEALELADRNNELLKKIDRAKNDDERERYKQEMRANNERISRLMIEAKYGGVSQ